MCAIDHHDIMALDCIAVICTPPMTPDSIRSFPHGGYSDPESSLPPFTDEDQDQMSSFRKPLLHNNGPSAYGATSTSIASISSGSSPVLDRVPEEDNDGDGENIELELEEQGYFIGAYSSSPVSPC